MSDYLAIASRRISGTGIIKIPIESSNLRKYILFADIIRQPSNRNFNKDYSPPKSFYARINLLSDGYVVGTFPMEWDTQKWEFISDITGQNLIAIKCMYDGILESFANLGEALGLTVISVENTIKEYNHLPIFFDQINVQMFSDGAFQFTLIGLPYDFCEVAYSIPNPLPSSPAKPEAVPIGTPTNISPPYDGDTVTDPSPLDDNYVPPPLGTACVPATLRFDYVYLESGIPTNGSKAIAVWGKVGQSWRTPSSGVIEIQTQGYYPGEACGVFDWRQVESLGAGRTIQSVSNIRIT